MKKLPLKFGLGSAFSHQACLLSILNAYEECKPWIFSNYIEIYTYKSFFEFERGDIEYYFNQYGDMEFYDQCTCPWLQYNCISRNDIFEHWNSIHQFIKERIDDNEYIYVTLNCADISVHSLQSCHPVLIFGYDSSKSKYYIADNLNSGIYDEAEVSFNEIKRAFYVEENEDKIISRTRGVRTFKKLDTSKDFEVLKDLNYIHYINHLSNIKLKTNQIKQQLKRYLKIDTPLEYLDLPNYIFGIDCMYALSESYSYMKEHRMDFRPLSVLLDHKNIMCERIKFLIKNCGLPEYFNQFSEVYDKLKLCRNLLIKYQYTHDDKILDRCYVRTKEATEMERNILTNMIDFL